MLMLRKIAWMLVIMYNYNKYIDVAGSLIFCFLELYYSLNSKPDFLHLYQFYYSLYWSYLYFIDFSGVQQA